MHKAKAFFYVCAGICLLALSYHLGARSAVGQAPGNPVVSISTGMYAASQLQVYAVTPNGDTYSMAAHDGRWRYLSNVFGGGTPAQRESWGQLKRDYRDERGTAQPQDR